MSQYPPPTGEVGTATPRRAAAASIDSCTMRRQLPARASVAVGSSKKVRCSPDFITIGCPSASVSFAGRIHVATTWLPGSKLKRFKESKSLLRRTMPVARRALGEGHRLTLKIRWNYAQTLCYDPSSTLDERHEAVSTLEDS